MKLLMTLVLVLLLAGCAAGQGGAGQTPAEEETTAKGTEETTAYKEETTVQKRAGGRARPPDSTLSYGGQEVKGTLGSYCWFSGDSGACADAPFLVPSKQKTLTVPSGSEMVFRYGGQSSPDTVKANAFTLNKKGYQVYSSRRSLKVHGSGVERTIHAELPPGEYGVDVFVIESQGDANYTFHVMVE